MPELLHWDRRPEGVDALAMLKGRITYEGPFGQTRFVIDTEAFDIHLDVGPDYHPDVVQNILTGICEPLGFEPLDEDECEPELLENGWTRIYLTPIVPYDDEPLVPSDKRGGK